ncbi:SIS domain-containing protein [Streptomyces hygroscopicus]|uniref:SIS domain-containing protein n=1 Tax=Streptomyces hygroscopicus TaxID=1912 RepID=UPI0007DB29BE|nr:SIS domain-containing protein [Streptomyces sp. NBRC 109436]
MEPIQPEVMVRQVEALSTDLRTRTDLFTNRVSTLLSPAEWESIDTVILTGNGDSHHAACAAEMAFETFAEVTCEPLSAWRFLHYSPPLGRRTGEGRTGEGRTLVIATSASGGTKGVVQAIERAKADGALTVALTGTPGSAVTRAADRFLLVDLEHPERSPGIRTYQASVLGMLLIALQLAEARRADSSEAVAASLRRELSGLADTMDATTKAIKERCARLAEVIAKAPVVTMVGSGPNHGTAQYGAAKLAEAAGVFAAGQDLEEWSHVERFAYPVDMPVFVIAPPGRSQQRAARLAEQAFRLGRHVIAVIDGNETDLIAHADAVLPVHGTVREEFSPLLYHLFAGYTASYTAQRLERLPFQADRSSS